MGTTRRISISALVWLSGAQSASALQVDLTPPSGSAAFGSALAVLHNGNIVVTDPLGGPVPGAGAVYLLDPDGSVINTVFGSSPGDQIGSGGIVVLPNGNYVVRSPHWHNAGYADSGAVTWGSAATGIPGGLVSSGNSLVGSKPDHAGTLVVILNNGNYVVVSPAWSNGAASAVGAVTFGNGDAGVAGPISASNSLIGATANDNVGLYGVTALSSGDYVVISSEWTNPASQAATAGAVTIGNGVTGTTGVVTSSNSIVGTEPGDFVGGGGVIEVGAGHIAISSPEWSDPATSRTALGAVTWGDVALKTAGAVMTTNSVTGLLPGDKVGSGGVFALRNGNYVVASPDWNGKAGAVTWANGASPSAFSTSVANSVTGTAADDRVGGMGITPLANGNYVVDSPYWDNGNLVDAGAVTWLSGSGPTAFPVSALNSLIGTHSGDMSGFSAVTPLPDGNYVVSNPAWNGTRGAVTWASGTQPTADTISDLNSLTGATWNNLVGAGGVVALLNGRYVVSSPFWDSDTTPDVGAVTVRSGPSPVGPVSGTNSLLGSNQSDKIGGNTYAFSSVFSLETGDYVVSSPEWNNGAVPLVGAVTLQKGNVDAYGFVTMSNSFIGFSPGDRFGDKIVQLGKGGFLVITSSWHDSGYTGAISLFRGQETCPCAVSAANTFLGSSPDSGKSMTYTYDARRDRLVVGQPSLNRVSFFYADLLFRNGFDN